MYFHWDLPPHTRAAFATSARILSCLTTESLLDTLYLPVASTHTCLAAVVLLLVPRSRNCGPHPSAEIFAVVPLHHVPVFKPGSASDVGLLDPLDMLPFIYEVHDSDNIPAVRRDAYRTNLGTGIKEDEDPLGETLFTLRQSGYIPKDAGLAPAPGPLHIWDKYAHTFEVREDTRRVIAAELSSSILWQQYAYEHPPLAPTFDSPSIAWEQCIIEGHPTHLMHKSRYTTAPITPIQPGGYDWYHPHIRFVLVPRSRIYVYGPWDDLIEPIRTAAGKNAKAPLEVPEDHMLVPVHELQLANIYDKFPEACVLPPEFSVDALAQQSVRSVLVPSALQTHSLKLALGVRLTSALRTISPQSAYLGPRFSSSVVPRLQYDRTLLIVQRELASIVHADSDPEIARHFACTVREAYENTSVEAHGERVIVCSALMETGHGWHADAFPVPLVQTVFGLDTKEKRLTWLDTFIDTYFRAFLPPVLANGVAFEAHPQNTLARFDCSTRRLTGFLIRDFGGLRIHGPTLRASTGLTSLDELIAPGHSVLADTLDDVYTRLYNTAVHNFLQRLIRVLGLHHRGEGWALVRRHVRAQLPRGHALTQLWLAPMLPGKCFMRMRLQGMDRTHLHSPVPNLIHYKGEGSVTQDETSMSDTRSVSEQ